MDKQRISLGRIIGKIWVGTALVAGLAVWAAAGEARAREFVAFPQTYPPGTIIIKQSERRVLFHHGSGDRRALSDRGWPGGQGLAGRNLRSRQIRLARVVGALGRAARPPGAFEDYPRAARRATPWAPRQSP